MWISIRAFRAPYPREERRFLGDPRALFSVTFPEFAVMPAKVGISGGGAVQDASLVIHQDKPDFRRVGKQGFDRLNPNGGRALRSGLTVSQLHLAPRHYRESAELTLLVRSRSNPSV